MENQEVEEKAHTGEGCEQITKEIPSVTHTATAVEDTKEAVINPNETDTNNKKSAEIKEDSNNKIKIEPTPKETVDFKVVFNKKTHNVTFDINESVVNLKKHLKTLIEVEPTMQKLMFKGLAKDDQTLRQIGVKKNSKLMVIGSKVTDIFLATKPAPAAAASKDEVEEKKESITSQKIHAKVIEKGIPDDAMPGYENGHESLPNIPLKGMTNKHGSKVRLTFKLQEDELWLGTKERTEKLRLGSIKDVITHKIPEHRGYSMIALQLGPTEQSRYWIYWVPSQYVAAVKNAILGTWQLF